MKGNSVLPGGSFFVDSISKIEIRKKNDARLFGDIRIFFEKIVPKNPIPKAHSNRPRHSPTMCGTLSATFVFAWQFPGPKRVHRGKTPEVACFAWVFHG